MRTPILISLLVSVCCLPSMGGSEPMTASPGGPLIARDMEDTTGGPVIAHDLTAGPIGGGGGAGTPPDLSNKFIAWWNAEEAANSTRFNASGTTCPVGDCDLDVANTVGKNTTHFREGVASADGGDDLECPDTDCDELDRTTGQSISFGTWMRDVNDAANAGVMQKFSAGGWSLLHFGTTNDKIRCSISDGTTTSQDSSTASVNQFQMTLVGCVFDNINDEIIPYVEGIANGCTPGSTCATKTDITGTAANFIWNFADGQGDAAFVYGGVMSPQMWCHVCSCGIDGPNGPCTCDGSTYSDDGRRTSIDCNSCTLPSDCQSPFP